MEFALHIAFEVVPRNHDSMIEQIKFVEENLDFIDTINVPDILRFPIRSWDVGEHLNKNKYKFIPHFRAIDFNLEDKKIFHIIEKYNLNEVLLVSGDPPPNMSYGVYDTNILDLISAVRSKFPTIKIYAGFDPYRGSIKSEKNMMLKKLKAGADYLMSQPFFDIKFLEIFSDLVPKERLFLGISPVVNDKSQKYWENMNSVVFPNDFDATYEWNIDFAQKVLNFCTTNGSNVYFMPINIDLNRYFIPIKDLLKK